MLCFCAIILLFCSSASEAHQSALKSYYPRGTSDLNQGAPPNQIASYLRKQSLDYNAPITNDETLSTTDSYANIVQTTSKPANPNDRFKFFFPAVLVFFKVFYLFFIFILFRVTLFRNIGVVASNTIPGHRSAEDFWIQYLDDCIENLWQRNMDLFQSLET